MALRIRIEHGQDAGKTLRLAQPGIYRFGRSPQGSGQVLDMKVSKEHFEIYVSADGAELRDLGSSHGTLLNGQIVPKEPRPLRSGDEIRVGMTVMRAMSDGPGDSELKPVGPLPSAAGPAGGASAGGSTAGGSAAGGKANGGSSDGGTTPNRGAVGKPVAKALPADSLVGTTLSGYRILEKVGAGGMGSVYRAEQLSLHREVAIKVLAEKLVSDSAFVDQFVNEARAAGQLNHPNVVQVYDVGQVDGRHFFSMEFIHGGSVEGKIPKTGGGVPWQDALNWFLDGANALIFAEQKGILHRDIKPDNFMVGQEGSVKLCDLGLAKKSESADLLAQGIIGTPHFIAPEAIRRKTDVDQRADLYSLGCTFYRVLTGKNPYPGTSVKEILLSHLNAPIPRASAIAQDVPKDLEEVIAKLMAKDPAMRFQNADALWEALDKIRLQHGLEAHGLHPGRTKKLLYVAIGLLVIGAGVVVAMKPWEKKIEKGDDVVTVVDNTDKDLVRREAEQAANNAFLKLKGDILEKLGKPDERDAWEHKPEWDAAIQSLNDFAANPKYGGMPAAQDAADHAKDLRTRWDGYFKKQTQLAGARKAANDSLDKATNDALNASIAKAIEKDWLGAMREIESGRKAVKEIGAQKVDDVVLVAEKKWSDAEAALEKQATAVLEAATKDLEESVNALKILVGAASTTEQFDSAWKGIKKWIDDHPASEGDDPISKLINTGRATADELQKEVVANLKAGQRDTLLVDRTVYFDLLTKLFTPLDDIGQGGGSYAGMRLGDAVTKTRAAEAKTDPFKVLFALVTREADLISRLPETLATGFKAKGFKEKLVGKGWSGVPKDFKSDGVVTSDNKTHLYSDEGPSWFVELFFDKGAERYPLTADEHEALGALAEAAGIVEPDGAKRFDLAIAEFTKAAALDAARADRMEKRKPRVESEKAAKLLLEESSKLVEDANREVDEHMEKLPGSLTDAKKYDELRKAVLAAEGTWRKAVETATTNVKTVIEKWPSTIVRQLLDTKVADDVTFGVTIPPVPKDRGGNAPPPAPAPAAPPSVPPEPPPDRAPAPAPPTPPKPPAAPDPTPGMDPLPGTDAPPAMR